MGYTSYKLKHNRREKEIQQEGIKDGWEVLYKGWPDFLFYKMTDGKIEAFCIEVKRNPKRECDKKYIISSDQEKMFNILRQLGLEVKIIYKD